MKKKNGELKKAGELRKGAAEKFKSNPALPEKLSKLDVQELIEELRIHQIQLEMQNDELRKTQQVVEESRAKYSDLYDFAPVGYLTLNQGGLILEVNLTASSQLGVERSRLIYKPLFLFITKKEGKDLFNRYLGKVFKTKSLETYEGELKGKDDTPFYAQLESIVVKDNPSQCRTAITDITERKQIEKTLQQANVRLKELSSVKDDFVAHVSHELRTPLTSVKEGLSLLADGILGPVTPRQQEFLKTVNQNTDRLAEIITNLLDLSKIEAGRMQLARRRMAIQPLVETVLKSCAPITKGRALKAQIDPVPDLFADSGKILQVLTNLIANAVKFTKEDGEITVSVRSQERSVAVSVRDNGVGIAKEDLPKLFQKFSQVGPLGVHLKGTGLGLALCKEIVSIHQGTIAVTSEPGAGSTFTFTLPVYTPELALEESFQEQITLTQHSGSPALVLMTADCELMLPSSEKQLEALERLAEAVRPQLKNGDIIVAQEPKWLFILAVTDPRGAQAIAERIRKSLGEIRVAIGTAFYPVDGVDLKSLMAEATSKWEGKGLSTKRILLADDDPMVLEVIRLRLQAAGFEVTTASDGEEVLKNMRGDSPIDLVLLDFKMPKMDGLEICRQLKERPPHRKIPLIACTAYWQELESRRSELGITDLLRKPFRSKELLEKIQRALAAP